MKIPSDGEMGWSAGMLDGEGTIELAASATVRIRISNTYLPALLKLRELWLGKIDKQSEGVNFPIYIWSESGSAACAILEALLPFLTKKRKAAEWAIRFYYNVPDARGKSGGLTEEDIKTRALYKEIIRRANRTGG